MSFCKSKFKDIKKLEKSHIDLIRRIHADFYGCTELVADYLGLDENQCHFICVYSVNRRYSYAATLSRANAFDSNNKFAPESHIYRSEDVKTPDCLRFYVKYAKKFLRFKWEVIGDNYVIILTKTKLIISKEDYKKIEELYEKFTKEIYKEFDEIKYKEEARE